MKGMVVQMKLFIDTANIAEIKDAYEMGVISGVTTNPSIIAKEGKEFETAVREIVDVVGDTCLIFAEVISLEADGMVEEAKKLAAIHPNMIIKIPMCKEGLKAVSRLKGTGIKTTCTLCFSAAQALLAARAGASYVAPFAGRLDDIGTEGMNLIADIAEIFAIHDISTQIIVASTRGPMHIIEAAKAGADIATVPYKVIMQMVDHPLTKSGLEQFMKDWEKVPQ